MNLKDCQIPPQVANAVIGLFSDPVSVTKLQEAYIAQKQLLEQEIDNRTNNKVNEQNNTLEDTTNLQEQNQ